MAEGLQQSWWAHDAWICHVIANVNRDPESPPILPAAVNPLLLETLENCGSGQGIDLDPVTIRVIADGLRKKREAKG
jgi:hypothetical protein